MYKLNSLHKKTICHIVDAEEVIHLQAAVMQALPEDKKLYIKKRSRNDYQSHIASRSLLGMYWDNQLVAVLLFTKHDAASYETDFNQTQQFSNALKPLFDFGIMGALMVHPDYQGNGFAHELITYALTMPECAMLDKIFAETIDSNTISISCFTDNGFSVVGNEYYEPLNTSLCLLEYIPAEQSLLSTEAA